MQDTEIVLLEKEVYKEGLEKALAKQNNEYMLIRAGRANPHILDKVMFEYYGTMTPVNQMANITVPEARVLMINCYDASQVKNVSKAIQMADLGVNPSDDGKTIRLVFPALTTERRVELVKQVKKLCEDCKIAMRNARRDVLESYKKMKKDNMLSEDELHTLEDEVQKTQDKYIKLSEENATAKEKEVMEI